MKITAILVFTSLWLIHIRVANANQGYNNNYRPGPGPGPMQLPYRRAHHPSHNKPSGLSSQYRKKWHPQHMAAPNHQRPRRPPPSPMGPNYMRQRLGLPHPPTLPALPTPSPTMPTGISAQGAFKLAQAQQLQQQQVQKLRNYNKAQSNPKWAFPSRNLKPQPPLQQPQQVHQQKPFLSSPKIQTEVEYHIQSNQIPNHQPVMIKQLDDEKGPIHTIPAPNLSPADKPKGVHVHQPVHFETSTHRVVPKPQQPSHQYQVTENQPENREVVPQQEAEVPPLKPEVLLQSDQVYSLLPVQDGYAYSVLHQPQLQQHLLQQQQPNAYQTMLVQPQFFHGEPSFLESQAQHKQLATPPEMHSFNYEEPKLPDQVSHVSAEYVLQHEEESERRPMNDDSNDANGADRDSDRDGDGDGDGDGFNDSFFSSLPNKEAADSFAHLLDAGRRQNYDQHHQSTNQQEMMIYVPDEHEQFDPAEDLQQYEAHDGQPGAADNGKKFGFGSRIRPKKSS